MDNGIPSKGDEVQPEKERVKGSINQSINQRLYLTSNLLLIAILLISPKKINL